jgi:DASH complex subunit DAD2
LKQPPDQNAAKIPKPKSAAEDDPFTTAATDDFDGFPKNENGIAMPQTLVRIPVQDQQK